MKKLMMAVLCLTTVVTAFAQERVLLDRESITINSHDAILVRTKDSPNRIDIEMLVPMSEPVCERYDTRYVLRASAVHCGVIRERRVEMGRVCVQRDPSGVCRVYRREEVVSHYDRPRTCSVPETFCAQYGSVTDFEKDGVKIKFKNAYTLTEGQEETFSIRAQQKVMGGSNVVYDIRPVQTSGDYDIKSKGWFGADSYEIKAR